MAWVIFSQNLTNSCSPSLSMVQKGLAKTPCLRKCIWKVQMPIAVSFCPNIKSTLSGLNQHPILQTCFICITLMYKWYLIIYSITSQWKKVLTNHRWFFKAVDERQALRGHSRSWAFVLQDWIAHPVSIQHSSKTKDEEKWDL